VGAGVGEMEAVRAEPWLPVAPGAPVGDLHEREGLRLGTDHRVDLREAGLGLAQVDPDDLLDASGLGRPDDVGHLPAVHRRVVVVADADAEEAADTGAGGPDGVESRGRDAAVVGAAGACEATTDLEVELDV